MTLFVDIFGIERVTQSLKECHVAMRIPVLIILSILLQVACVYTHEHDHQDYYEGTIQCNMCFMWLYKQSIHCA